MATILITICDKHPEAARIPATHLTLSLDGRALEAELCAECAAPYREVFEQFAEFARPVRKPVRAHIPTRTPRAQLAGRTHEQRQSREGGNFPIVSEPTIPDSETDENGQFPCGYCPESFPNQISRGAHRFRGHGVRKHPLKHSCKFCDFKAATPSRIAEHVAKEHPQEVLAEAG